MEILRQIKEQDEKINNIFHLRPFLLDNKEALRENEILLSILNEQKNDLIRGLSRLLIYEIKKNNPYQDRFKLINDAI